MPQFRLETNIPKEKIPKNFALELHKLIAKILDKSEQHVCITIIPDMNILLAGVDENVVMASLISVGKISREENIKHSKPICEKIVNDLGVDSKRIYIRFMDEKAENFGSDYTTFAILPVS